MSALKPSCLNRGLLSVFLALVIHKLLKKNPSILGPDSSVHFPLFVSLSAHPEPGTKTILVGIGKNREQNEML